MLQNTCTINRQHRVHCSQDYTVKQSATIQSNQQRYISRQNKHTTCQQSKSAANTVQQL